MRLRLDPRAERFYPLRRPGQTVPTAPRITLLATNHQTAGRPSGCLRGVCVKPNRQTPSTLGTSQPQEIIWPSLVRDRSDLHPNRSALCHFCIPLAIRLINCYSLCRCGDDTIGDPTDLVGDRLQDAVVRLVIAPGRQHDSKRGILGKKSQFKQFVFVVPRSIPKGLDAHTDGSAVNPARPHPALARSFEGSGYCLESRIDRIEDRRFEFSPGVNDGCGASHSRGCYCVTNPKN